MSKKNRDEINPAEHKGTPQHVAAVASGETAEAPPTWPGRKGRVNLTYRKLGNRMRNAGLWKPVPEEFNGGEICIRPATVRAVVVARDDYGRKLRESPAVKASMAKKDELPNFAARDELRFLVLRCFVDWRGSEPFDVRGEDGKWTTIDINGWTPAQKRGFVEDYFLPPVPLVADAEVVEDLDEQFQDWMIAAVGEVSRVPAEEIARMGEAFRLGHSPLSTEDD
jgi:hypothetical protein